MAEVQSGKQPKVAPPRNELRKVELSRNSRATELQGREPGFVYEYFSDEPDHPAYIGKAMAPHEVGDGSVGFAVIEKGWEVCQSAVNAKARALDPRTDQGKPIDSTVRHGRQTLCRLPVEEYEKYKAVEAARIAQRSKDLFATPDRLGSPGSTVTTLNSHDLTAEPADLLKRANHPGA